MAIGIMMNPDKDESDMKSPERQKPMSGICELLREGQNAQVGVPSLQAVEDDGDDALKHAWPQLLSDEDLRERLQFLSNWKLSPDRRSIARTFQARNFSEGINFFNAVAKLADGEGHHPDLHLTEFRKVTVVLMSAEQLPGLSTMDITMAERINNIDVQYSETAQEFEFSLQKYSPRQRYSPRDSKIKHPQLSESKQPDNSPELQPVLEVQPDTSCQHFRQNSEAAEPQSRKISIPDRSDEVEAQPKDTPTLLHSLILVFADAGAGGLSIQEAVRRIRKQGLPGLRDKGKAVQVAKITRSHSDFVGCDSLECFALRKALLRSFQCGSLDPEEYADEKKMETAVFEKYFAAAAAMLESKSKPNSPRV